MNGCLFLAQDGKANPDSLPFPNAYEQCVWSLKACHWGLFGIVGEDMLHGLQDYSSYTLTNPPSGYPSWPLKVKGLSTEMACRLQVNILAETPLYVVKGAQHTLH
ncbi:hypothetical protein BABINDRAFT_160598 [Babjeviella inositovora NRRL Y-12698]|uniref:Uncharacterized protein n=1 Tax=Babjeviella inositovora NRRL Y-12698 TaxID=984486 RepID=A0A1E3QU67_9ASCO|nr:uncharacterized protein BABINDRAFT_160598 [Babjeviella inositovora NRRL Y-12698]ODQ81210.1 hypothetical protein BABINDRAFT_160598 [Babjeviella inositovora NRRL Y-12698]